MMKAADFFGKKARSLLDKSFAVKISQNPRPLLSYKAMFVKFVEERLFWEAGRVEAVQISPRMLQPCG